MSEYNYEKKYDVVIIGGGVIGCSIAYHLARDSKGKLKVAVIERNIVGEEASSGAAGMLAAQIEADRPGPFLDLAVHSRGLFGPLARELKDLTGVDVEYAKGGILSAAFTDADAAALKERLAWQKSAGLSCDWLTPDKVSAAFPFLKPGSLGGFWVPEDGQVSSNRLTAAFAEGAKKLGVEFFENESFDEVRLDGPRLSSVETNLSKFVAGNFVFAAGAWTGGLLGAKAPVGPVKGQVLIFRMPEKWREARPWVSPVFCGTTPGPGKIHCYFVPKMDGCVWVGATMEDRGMDKSENESATREISDYVSGVFPDIASFPYHGCWVGLRPAAPDRLPVIGLVSGSRTASCSLPRPGKSFPT